MKTETLKTKKMLLAAWVVASIVFLIETIGGLPFGAPLLWFSGFMTARSIANIVQPNAGNQR